MQRGKHALSSQIAFECLGVAGLYLAPQASRAVVCSGTASDASRGEAPSKLLLRFALQPVLALYSTQLMAQQAAALAAAGEAGGAGAAAEHASSRAGPGASMSRGLGAGAADSGAGLPYQLSPYQCTGLVVDVGESGTSIVPVRASLFCHLPAGSLQLLRPPHVQVVGGDQPHVI